ncbi:hypothetical protein AB0K68_52850, partial [Streptomyces sp. NPDC050698]
MTTVTYHRKSDWSVAFEEKYMSRRPTSRALSGALATATVLATVTAAGTLSAGTAGAAPAADIPFGGWSSCPIDNPETSTCMDVT